MYLRQCKDCSIIFKSTKKNTRYCEDCFQLRRDMRITKIKIADYERSIIYHRQLLIKIYKQHVEICKGNKNETENKV